MGRSRSYTSPASKIRSLKRAIHYFKSKGLANTRKVPKLIHAECLSVDIPPQSVSPILTISVLESISISPNSLCIPTCEAPLSRQPYKIPSNPSQSGYLTLDVAKQLRENFNQQPLLTRPQPAPNLLQCIECENTFQTKDDMRWHQENKFGREDCVILQKMMLSEYLCKPVI